jgi:hypothetical protein
VQENEVFFKLFFPENGRELLRLAKSTKAEFLLLDFLFQLFQKNFGGTMWPPRRRGSESNGFWKISQIPLLRYYHLTTRGEQSHN